MPSHRRPRDGSPESTTGCSRGRPSSPEHRPPLPPGIDVHARLGDQVEAGQPLFTLHAQAPGELAYALQFVRSRPPIFQISENL